MPLEASIVLLDNSEFAINSDYGNTRWDSQLDATKVIFNAKTGSNPESSVGLMTIAGTRSAQLSSAIRPASQLQALTNGSIHVLELTSDSPSVLVSPTNEYGKIAVALNGIKLHGRSDVVTGINVAQLALKHRQNKNQRQRVIVFVGSPLSSSAATELVKLGKKMKKNNVAVDVINFGEDAENEEVLKQFVESVNSSDNSHLVSVAAGTVLLSDMIVSSAMLSEDGVGPSGDSAAGPSGGESGEFGVDPNLDPELAMALRMSLEEERLRTEAAQRAQQSTSSTAQEASTSTSTSPAAATNLTPDLAASAASGPAAAPAVLAASESAPVGLSESLDASPIKQEESMEEDEDADLAMALALSRGDDVEMEDVAENDEGGDDNDEGLTEEEAIARAIALSMKEQAEGDQTK